MNAVRLKSETPIVDARFGCLHLFGHMDLPCRPVRPREKFDIRGSHLQVSCALSSVLIFVLATRSLTLLIEFELSKHHKCLRYHSRI